MKKIINKLGTFLARLFPPQCDHEHAGDFVCTKCKRELHELWL